MTRLRLRVSGAALDESELRPCQVEPVDMQSQFVTVDMDELPVGQGSANGYSRSGRERHFTQLSDRFVDRGLERKCGCLLHDYLRTMRTLMRRVGRTLARTSSGRGTNVHNARLRTNADVDLPTPRPDERLEVDPQAVACCSLPRFSRRTGCDNLLCHQARFWSVLSAVFFLARASNQNDKPDTWS